jgi:hypothetical protein
LKLERLRLAQVSSGVMGLSTGASRLAPSCARSRRAHPPRRGGGRQRGATRRVHSYLLSASLAFRYWLSSGAALVQAAPLVHLSASFAVAATPAQTLPLLIAHRAGLLVLPPHAPRLRRGGLFVRPPPRSGDGRVAPPTAGQQPWGPGAGGPPPGGGGAPRPPAAGPPTTLLGRPAYGGAGEGAAQTD